jgi:hypothetical protein
LQLREEQNGEQMKLVINYPRRLTYSRTPQHLFVYRSSL